MPPRNRHKILTGPVRHDCMNHAIERHATANKPYHYVGSGLSNVFLIGITYRLCPVCRFQAGDIPAIKQLHRLIARQVMAQAEPLLGEQMRFLRKELGEKASEFAKIIDVAPETYSRWENGRQRPSLTIDLLVRLYYALNCGDPESVETARQVVSRAAVLRRRRKPPNIAASLEGNRWRAPHAA